MTHEASQAAPLPFRLVERLFGAICVLCIFAMCIIMCWDVLFRYVLIRPLAWSQEVIQFLMAIAFSAGLPIVSLHHGHIVVDVVSTHFRGRTALAAGVFVQLAIGAFMALLCWACIGYAQRQMVNRDSTDWLHWPWHYATWTIAASSAVVVLICAASALRILRGAEQ